MLEQLQPQAVIEQVGQTTVQLGPHTRSRHTDKKDTRANSARTPASSRLSFVRRSIFISLLGRKPHPACFNQSEPSSIPMDGNCTAELSNDHYFIMDIHQKLKGAYV
ncbi:MAG: hypothetical protein HQ494_00185 [Rhodospirillales bacterium]|nr:hypothetical protein [Rhodospirillales bacterium]